MVIIFGLGITVGFIRVHPQHALAVAGKGPVIIQCFHAFFALLCGGPLLSFLEKIVHSALMYKAFFFAWASDVTL